MSSVESSSLTLRVGFETAYNDLGSNDSQIPRLLTSDL